MKMIRGFYGVLVTPLDDAQQVDKTALRQLIRFQIEAGVDGLVFLGTTGEAPTLTWQEKEIILQIGREETEGKVHFMVGAGSYSTAQTIANAQQAQACGADSLMIVTPYYNRPTQEGIYSHFKALVNAIDLPILVYNNPPRCSQNIQTETLMRICTLPGIYGVKEASGNLAQIMEVIEQTTQLHSSFSVMCGDDLLTMPSIAMGADGILSAVSNVAPLAIRALVTALEQGHYPEARALHYQLMPLIRLAFLETNPTALKHLMNAVGISVGGCRLPLCDIKPENARKIQEALKEGSPLSRLLKANLEWPCS